MKLNCQGLITNILGNIWVFWEPNIKCTVMLNSTQHITLQIEVLGGLSILFTFVYASCDGTLWTKFNNINTSLPWMAVGDFNVVARKEVKAGGNAINKNDVLDFKNMIACNGLKGGGYS